MHLQPCSILTCHVIHPESPPVVRAQLFNVGEKKSGETFSIAEAPTLDLFSSDKSDSINSHLSRSCAEYAM